MAKTRADSWAAQLTAEQQDTLYGMAKRLGTWRKTAEWAQTEFGLEKPPSQSGFYRWMDAMEKEEHERRLEEVAIAAAQMTALGSGKLPSDEEAMAAFKALAYRAAMNGDASDAVNFFKYASAVHKYLTKDKALALEQRRVETMERKDERERAAAEPPDSDSTLTPEEKEEKLKEIFGF